MHHTSGNEFVKKSRERQLAQKGDIYVAGSTPGPVSSVYLPEEHPAPRPSYNPSGDTSSPIAPPPEVITSVMTGREKAKFMLMRTTGNFLVLLCLYGVVATFGPALFYEAQFQLIKARGIEYKVAQIKKGEFSSSSAPSNTLAPGFGDIIAGAKEQVLVPPDTQFSIIIPKLGATAKIWPNVDPLKEDDFLPKLQSGVAHAKGSVFPGMEGNVYLFAHSTDNFWDVGRYNAVFYLLKDMQPGDAISVYFENTRYNYKVDHTVIKDPSDVDLLIHSQVPGKEQLILQTCWPPGTTWKRLFVIATPEGKS